MILKEKLQCVKQKPLKSKKNKHIFIILHFKQTEKKSVKKTFPRGYTQHGDIYLLIHK